MLKKLNCRIYSLAKDIAREEIRCPNLSTITHTTAGIDTISHDNSIATSRVQHILYSRMLHSNLVSWYSGKFGIDKELLTEQVHWRSSKLARKESRFGLSVFITKWLSGDTATGKVMVQRKQRVDISCPRCSHPYEHTEHILKCQSNNICEIREKSRVELIMWIKSIHTQPDIDCFYQRYQIRLSNDLIVFELDTLIDPVILSAPRYTILL